MKNTTSMNIRMDVELKKQAEEIFADLGLNMTVAMTMFLRQVVRNQGIPFDIYRIPSKDVVEMMEAEKGKGA